MSALTESQALMAAAGILLLAVVAIAYLGTRVAVKHDSDVRMVWFFFSLSVTSTAVAALWASSVGAVDATGNFQGRWGSAVNSLLHFMLDLETDTMVFAGLLALFVVPQVLSYFLSGLFGCASSPIFIGKAFGIFVWCVAKSLVVAAGIFSVIGVYGWAAGWNSWNLRGASSMLAFSFLLLVLSFGCLYVYRDIHDLGTKEGATPKTRIPEFVKRADAWFKRRKRGDSAA